MNCKGQILMIVILLGISKSELVQLLIFSTILAMLVYLAFERVNCQSLILTLIKGYSGSDCLLINELISIIVYCRNSITII